jgi:hypothetical protein
MHHFIYPSKDTYITNETNYLSKNLGIDELLEVKAKTQLYKTVTLYASQSVSASYDIPSNLYKFTGSVNNGYVSGYDTGSLLVVSGNSDVVAYNYFTGTVTGSLNGTTYTGSISNTHCHIAGLISGSLTGSWSGSICNASGTLRNFIGVGQGAFVGTQSVYSPSTTFQNIPSLSRALLKFDISSISASIANGSIQNTGSLKFTLKMKVTEANELPLSYSMYAYPVSQSWEMGDGRYEQGGSSYGASWYYRNYSGDSGSYWYPLTGSNIYNFVDYLNTASYASESFNKGGGTWYYSVPNTYATASSGFCAGITTGSTLIAKQNFNYETSDINMDVTSIVNSWICGCVPNEGIIILTSLELSQADGTNASLRFYGKDTNTIYIPCLDAKWDDSIYTTGSLVAVSESIPFTVVAKNVSKNYKFGSIPRIDVYARAKNPLKNFVKGYQMNQYLTSSLLPTSSYYAIKDNESERVVVDFDEGTKLSCDGNIHYFTVDTTSLAEERFYRLLVKIVTNNTTQIFDNGYVFKITR